MFDPSALLETKGFLGYQDGGRQFTGERQPQDLTSTVALWESTGFERWTIFYNQLLVFEAWHQVR